MLVSSCKVQQLWKTSHPLQSSLLLLLLFVWAVTKGMARCMTSLRARRTNAPRWRRTNRRNDVAKTLHWRLQLQPPGARDQVYNINLHSAPTWSRPRPLCTGVEVECTTVLLGRGFPPSWQTPFISPPVTVIHSFVHWRGAGIGAQ